MRNRYRNLDNVQNRLKPLKLVSYFYNRNKGKNLKTTIPVCYPNLAHSSSVTYTWIGHSTFLIQIGKLNILTDPVFANRMGLEKRLVPVGIPVVDLPEIDLVFISHAHYDHLDFPSIKQIKGNPHFYVPVGVKKLFLRRGYQNVTEANWWESFSKKKLRVHFVPSQHWSRRSVFDKNRAHWGGWIISSEKQTFYFAGDTGYFRGFKEIEKHFTIDVAFIPIGDYEPEWLSGLSHINPENAVQAFQDLNAQTFVPMHYGTYRLSMDTGLEALERLYNEWQKRNLPMERLNVLKIGETAYIK
ncbi:MBL fold metallo-hydrolase [Halalkalibacter krulwichiae]|uniref:MBL fold metallo-hydrolase n=1 Tax=Halalkalibacter krulwichiae TaxID=199441 RepID=UPI000A004DD0|nr:MBL fold metallo-hydrolase [Halalkalibacter krulwichiae]